MSPDQLRDVLAQFEANVVEREAEQWQGELERRLRLLGEQLADVAAQAALTLPEADRSWFLARVRGATHEAHYGG
ncbi:hypothetical protein [Streptomyces sp. NPDC057301]|uniref:hypothetical protein n=1 Tax=Streptomyces sp. NPDC057301 TaxID=3346093 RepID=UPI0036294CEA